MNESKTGPTTLSTGELVEPPLTLSATITAGVFPASITALGEMLPDALRPLRVGARSGAVTILSVDYSTVGDDLMEPYNEVSIQIPAVERGTRTIPCPTGLRHSTSGYVWAMPVTTAPAKALGREVWGYPKSVADIEIDHQPSATETRVEADGRQVLSLRVERPRQAPMRKSGYTFTEYEGELVRESTMIRGRVGGWLRSGVSLTIDDHPLTEPLSKLDLGPPVHYRLGADCEFVIGPKTDL